MNIPSWQPLIEGMQEGVWIVDALDLRIVAVNRAAGRLLGIAADEMIGRPVVDFAHTPEDVFFWEDVAAGLSESIFSETLLRRAEGGVVHVDRHVSLVMMSGGETVYVVGLLDQSEQRRVEDELERLIAELRATLESTADGILVVDPENRIRSYNQRFAELWDLPVDLMIRRDDGAIFKWMSEAVADGELYADRLGMLGRSPLMEATDLLFLRSGRVLERVSLPQYARGQPIGRVFSYRDITSRLATERRLMLASQVFESSLDAIFVTDPGQCVIEVNRSCELLTGLPHDNLIGSPMHALFHQAIEGGGMPEEFCRQLAQQGAWSGDVYYRQRNGIYSPARLSLVRVVDAHGEPLHYIGYFRDLTEAQAARRRIEELAFTDTLTGLPNRILLNERIEFALGWSAREKLPFAVLFLDLDRFKHINDSLGHAFGDRILIDVAARIKTCLRQSDTAARLGGDEFVLLLHGVDQRGAELAAKRILTLLSEPFEIDGMSFTLTCSIGIALYPADGVNIEDLIKNADTAMYRVKERGRAGFRFYQQQMNIDLLSRIKLDQAMRRALDRGDFRLHYQPQVDLASGAIIGAEALIRWRDGELGDIPPGRFIPVAEETGFIVAIGDWVLREAVRQAAAWRADGVDLVVAVNVSALQFQKPDFVQDVETALQEAGLPANRLELEMTESILVRDADEALVRLNRLSDLGVLLSIDDFGTGYSSLAYLKRFPIDKLKIDRSFVDGLPLDESDIAIAQAIVSLGQALRLLIIAEGVEQAAQRDFLAAAGCHQYQGYLFAKALAPDAFLSLFSDRTA